MELLKFPISTISTGGDDDEESRTLWVGNIEDDVDEEILYELFLNSGPVSRVTVPRNKQTKKSKNFAFILFEHRESVPYAMAQMEGTTLYGRTIALEPHSRSEWPNKEMSFTNHQWNVSGIAQTLQEINQNEPKEIFGWEGSPYSNVKVKRIGDYSFAEPIMVKNHNDERSRNNEERSRERFRRGERREHMKGRRSTSREFDLRDRVNRRKKDSRSKDRYSYEMSRPRERDDVYMPRDSRSRDRHQEPSSRNGGSYERNLREYVRDRSHSRRNRTKSGEKDDHTRERSRRSEKYGRDGEDIPLKEKSRRDSRESIRRHDKRSYLEDRSSPDGRRRERKRKHSNQGRD